jgi:hypothetical protein
MLGIWNGRFRRSYFAVHREPFALKRFHGPTDKSGVAAEALMKLTAVSLLRLRRRRSLR